MLCMAPSSRPPTSMDPEGLRSVSHMSGLVLPPTDESISLSAIRLSEPLSLSCLRPPVSVSCLSLLWEAGTKSCPDSHCLVGRALGRWPCPPEASVVLPVRGVLLARWSCPFREGGSCESLPEGCAS